MMLHKEEHYINELEAMKDDIKKRNLKPLIYKLSTMIRDVVMEEAFLEAT